MYNLAQEPKKLFFRFASLTGLGYRKFRISAILAKVPLSAVSGTPWSDHSLFISEFRLARMPLIWGFGGSSEKLSRIKSSVAATIIAISHQTGISTNETRYQ